MGRPRKDKFEETSYAFIKGTEHERVYVSAPFWLNATIMNKYGPGTTEQLVRYLHQTRDEIEKVFQKNEWKVIKFENATMLLPNICERCGRKGTPIIQKKSNLDNRYRSRTNSPSRNNRLDEYWLNYQHTTIPKICRMALFDVNHFLFKNPKNRIIELHKNFFPFYLEKIKKELVA